MKRFTAIIAELFLAVALIPVFALQVSAVSNYGYDPDAALAYAAENWNIGDEVCDQFVKSCLRAGGVEVWAGGVKEVMDALLDAGYAMGYNQLKVDANDRYINESENQGLASPGDVLFYKCVDCDCFTHTVLISGYNQDQQLMAYGHNPYWDNYLWHGTIHHVLEDGTQHDNFEFYVVNMSTEDPDHKHVLARDLYEDEHPHLMYDECSVDGCDLKYYLGWNAKVRSCYVCNPSPAGKPVVSLELNDEGGVEVAWTALPNVAEYQVWRGLSETGKYFNISVTQGAYITNAATSITPGATYYYQVVAVLEDGTTVESDVTRIEIPGELGRPVVTLGNDEDGAVIISWDAVPGAQGYRVFRATSKDGEFVQWKENGVDDTDHVDTSVGAGGTYYYKVVALFGENTTESNMASITCPMKDLVATLSAGEGGVKVSWPSFANVTEYQVWRSKKQDGSFTQISAVTGTAINNSSVTPGVTYYYKLVALMEDGSRMESPVAGITVPGELGKAVIKLSLNEAEKVVLSWDAVAGADGYRIYRSTSADGSFKQWKENSPNDTSYTDTSVAAGGTYYYKVAALIGEATTESDIVSITCPAASKMDAPTITVGTRNSDGKPTISWKAVEGADGYVVYRSGTQKGTYTKLITVGADKLSVIHTGAVLGNDYFYKVCALDGKTEGEFSASKGVWCDLARPTVTVSNRASDGKPVISWTEVKGATGYEVYRCGTSGGSYTKLITVGADKLSVTHTGAAVGNDYFYKVKAVYGSNSKCDSAQTAAKGVWCDLPQPKITVGNRASDGKPVISWGKVSYASGYEVYYADTNTGTYKKLITVGADKLSVTHTGAKAGEDYFYKVTAVHRISKCTSAKSAAKGVWCDLACPTLTVTLNSKGKPYLKWTEAKGADAYKVYRSADDGAWGLIYTAAGDDLDVTHTGAKSGVTYAYKVIAICNTSSKANSAYSIVKTIICG